MPHLKKHVRKLERGKEWQQNKCQACRTRNTRKDLPPLEERRGIMIQMFKCMAGINKIDRGDFLELDTEGKIRGSHELKLRLPIYTSTTNTKKFSFLVRLLADWKGLLEDIVRARNAVLFQEKHDKRV